jgi:hypothetical protein
MQNITKNTSNFAPLVDNSLKDLTTHVNATIAVTGYANAILNLFIQPMMPLQPWYPSLNGNLDIAKLHAQGWADTLAPDINSMVPQAIIDYGNFFNAATNEILNILMNSNDNPSPTQMQTIVGLLQDMLKQLGMQQQVVSGLQIRLRQFSDDVLSDNNNLQTGTDSIQSALNMDEQTKQKIMGMIRRLQTDIALNSQKALDSEIGIGVGIFIAVAAFSLAVATGGLAAPLFVGAVALAGVGAAVGTTTAYSVDAQRDMSQLLVEQQKLTDEANQILALTGLVGTLNQTVALNEAAQQALTVVATQWDDLKGKLQSVITDLQEAGSVTGILQQVELQAGQTAWAQLVGFATQMQIVTSSITLQPALMPPAAAAAI